MFKRILLVLLLITAYCSLLTFPVSAHVLETDGSIGAVIHIDPEDDPIVGEQASFFFEFKDKEGKFNGTNCDCVAVISKNGQELFRGSIYGNTDQPSLENSSLFFTFPERGVYSLEIIGKPLTPGAFQEFHLKDELRVERLPGAQPAEEKSGNFFIDHKLHLVVFGVGLAIFLVMLFYKRKK